MNRQELFVQDHVDPPPQTAPTSAWPWLQVRYVVDVLRHTPVMFCRRVLLGSDPYWRQFFFNRWGRVSSEIRAAIGGRPVVWVSGHSGGEVTQAVTFTRRLREALPGHAIVFSSFNTDPLRFAASWPHLDGAFDTPWDLGLAVRRVLRTLHPVMHISLVNAPHPVLLRASQRAGVTTVLVNGRMRDRYDLVPHHARTRAAAGWQAFDWVGARSAEDREGFIALGVPPERVQVTGNLKWDLEFMRLTEDERDRIRASLAVPLGSDLLLVASMTQANVDMVVEGITRVQAQRPARVVMTPRYPNVVPQLRARCRASGLEVVTWAGKALPSLPTATVVVDTRFGQLPRLWGAADAALLGFNEHHTAMARWAGHSLIEPLAHGVPVCFGPQLHHWGTLVDEITRRWPTSEVTTGEELATFWLEMLQRPDEREAWRAFAHEQVQPHRDDVQRNVDFVLTLLGCAPQPAQELGHDSVHHAVPGTVTP